MSPHDVIESCLQDIIPDSVGGVEDSTGILWTPCAITGSIERALRDAGLTIVRVETDST